MMRPILMLALMLASAPLHAYHLEVRSDNPLVADEELRRMTLAAGEGVRHNIPESQEVYVYASTRAKPRDTDPTKYIYFHRIELRRHFTSDEPYPSNGWYSIKSEEFYGVDDANGVKSTLESTLRRFFSEVKNLSPTVRVK